MFSHQFPEKATLQEKFTDMQVSARVKLINPDMKGAYGLTIRSEDETSFYVFYAGTNGEYAFFLKVNDKWKPLVDWKENPYLNKGEWNKMAIQATGSHFRLLFNDNLLSEVDDASLKSGQGGIIIELFDFGEKIQVQFDDFEVRLPSPSSTSDDAPALTPALSDWNGIPIMPDALTGQEDMGDYQFTSKIPVAGLRNTIKLRWLTWVGNFART